MKLSMIVPCYNEAQTIEKVVTDWKTVLPEAVIYVYDNNSATRVKKGKKPKHTLSGSMKMIARIRLKEG